MVLNIACDLYDLDPGAGQGGILASHLFTGIHCMVETSDSVLHGSEVILCQEWVVCVARDLHPGAGKGESSTSQVLMPCWRPLI